MRRGSKVTGAGILMLMVMLLTAVAVSHAQVPQLPHLFYGSLNVGTSPAAAGRTIEAKVDGVVRGTLTTTAPGTYGGASALSAKLLVQGPIAAGSIIEFFVDGVLAIETAEFQIGAVTQLDLTAAAGTVVPDPSPGTDGGDDGGDDGDDDGGDDMAAMRFDWG